MFTILTTAKDFDSDFKLIQINEVSYFKSSDWTLIKDMLIVLNSINPIAMNSR